jgi:hypothetical protein
MATYGSETGVEAINAHLTGGYTATTTPNSTQIGAYLSDGYAKINLALARAGYTTPVASTAACYDAIVALNNLYAAAQAEEAANVATIGLEGESRSAGLWARYRQELADLTTGDLTLAGLSKQATPQPRPYVRSVGLRRRDGFAHRFDPDNSEYSR